jgi:hypothetical protein
MSGTIFKDGLTSEGTLSANSNITLGDVSEAGGPNGESQGSIVFGAGNDFRITTSDDSGVIRQQTAAKPLYLQPADSNSILITKSATPANKIAEFIEGGAVNLYNNTALKFSTNSAGIIITGGDTTTIGNGNVARNTGTVQAGIFKFDTGSDGSGGDANDHARIQTTWLANDSTTIDFIIEDNTGDHFRWRKRDGGLNNANYYSEMTLTSNAGGDVTLKVGGGFDKDATAVVNMAKGTVDADTFTGQAATVATISAFDTDDLNEGAGNLYHTTSRVTGAISLTTNATASGGGALTYSNSNGAFEFTPANLSSFLTAVPEATSSATGGIKTGYTESGKNYAVKISSGKAYVNVPWEDTDTDTWRPIDDTPTDGATTTSISSNWAFDNVKKAVPSNAVFINTTYSADGNYGMTMSGTSIRLENDRRRNSNSVDIYSGNTHDYTFYDASHGIRWYTGGAEEMRLENSGDLHVDGDITAFSSTVSDERLKKNIKVVDGALDKVSKLNGVTFDWKRDNRASAGLIAQDIEKVLPSAIKEKQLPFKSDDEEFYKTVEYSQVTALLVEAIKELKEQNELMKAEIEELKANK